MAAIDEIREYHMLDAELYSFASDLCQRLTRDIAELGFGITNASITALQALTDAFQAIPSDDGLIGDLMLATQTKNELAAQVRENIRNMALHIQLKWGTNSPQYRSLGDLSVSKFPDDVLFSAADNINKRMIGYLADLISTGLSQAMLDDFGDLITSFQSARNGVTNKIEARDNKTQERIRKGNELYGYVVNYCEIGKRVYEKTNPAKYNDYVIYTPSAGTLTPPQGLRFFFPDKKFSWEMVENASSYQLMASTDGENFFELYAGQDLEFVYIPVQNGYMWYKCRGRNQNGYGDFSETLQQGYYDILPAPQNLAIEMVTGSTDTVHLTWGEVASATKYSVSRSSVDFGSPIGTFVGVGEFETNSYTGTVQTNKRHYFHLTCENGNYQWSPISVNIYIDVQVAP